MKLRFRNNSVRLRLNRKEVESLSEGRNLEETVRFPGGSVLSYRLRAGAGESTSAQFQNAAIDIAIPAGAAKSWNGSDDVGLYYLLDGLELSLEKDLECTEPNGETADPYAYPRKVVC